MKTFRAAYQRLLGFLGAGVNGKDIDAELQSHIEMASDENVRAGMSVREAKRQAYLQLGGYERTRQAYTDRTTLPWLESLLQDARFATRQLRKSPGFAWTATTVFGLSLAAALVVFAFVDAALVRPLPYSQPTRLVALFERLASGNRFHLSYADSQDWKQRNRTLADMGVYRPDRFVLTTANGPEAVQGAVVSSGFFSTLGVRPIMGASFEAGDDGPGTERKAMLSYATWVQRYNADKEVIGRSVQLDKQACRIVGVLPENFHFAAIPSPAFWKSTNGYCSENASCYPYYAVGRLHDGVAISVARQDFVTLAGHIAMERPASNRDRSAEVLPLEVLLFGKVRPILLALLVGAGLLTLVGLVNVFTLVLIRAERRRHETATRSALGATRMRLFRQFLLEGALLACFGGGLGFVIASFSIEALHKQLSQATLDRMPYLSALQVSTHVLEFACVLTMCAAFLFGSAPLSTIGGNQLLRSLAEGGRNGTNRSWRRIGAGLSIVQLALTVVLLVSAGLLLESTRKFLHQDLGLTPEHLSMLHVQVQGDMSDAKEVGLVQDVIARIKSLPGVDSAGVSQSPPLNGTEAFRMRFTHFKVAGKVYLDLGNEAVNQIISMGYFETLQVRLLRGRFFSTMDRLKQQRVAIVNEAMVRENFAAGENPIGKRIVSHYDPDHPLEIVGIVQSAKEGSLDAPVAPAVYQPFEQAPDGEFYVLIRSATSDQAVLAAASKALHELNRELLIDGERTLEEEIQTSESAQLHQASARLASVSGALALILSTAGLYGLIAYSVGQRTREIGIRMALGAQRSSIYRMILVEAVGLTSVGGLFGIAISFMTTRLLGSMIYHVAPWDTKVIVSVVTALLLATLTASFLPARRAAFVEPTESLRAM